RCIRESIKELSDHPQISKELLFLDSDKGDKGFELIKKGKTITGIKFIFRWLKLGTIDELNQHEAMKTIRNLEIKRLQSNVRLSEGELESLAIAYRYIGKNEQALKIEESLSKRLLQQSNRESEDNQQAIDSLLDKIETLSKLSDNPDY
ncbi:replication protein, partial [Vibrio ichthyoenteri ATCC 700023]